MKENGVEEMKGEELASSGESFEIMSVFSDEESDSSGQAMVDNDKEECRYEVTPKFIEEKIVTVKDYLLSIAKVEPSQDVPPPHLERHQAWLLLGGNQKSFRDLETFSLGSSPLFSYDIVPDVLRHVNNLFKSKPKPSKGFVPMMAFMDTILKYDLPDFIPETFYYVSRVLAYEAITKVIMDLEGRGYQKATAIGVGIDTPTKTPYGLQWEKLVMERNQQRDLAKERSRNRKQLRPRRVQRVKEK